MVINISEEELNKLTIAQLKEKCAEKGIEVPEGAKKADIVALLVKDKAKKEVKEAPKEEAKKEVASAAKKAPTPKASKPATKAKKIKKETSAGDKIKGGLKKFDEKMDKIGYLDVYDYLTLIAGIWGMIFTVFFWFAYFGGGYTTSSGAHFVGSENLSAPLGNPASNNSWAGLFLLIIMTWIYINLILYPLLIDNLYIKVLDKPPLHFLHSKEDLRSFIIFLSFWSLIFFSTAGWALRWPHIIPLGILAFVLLADPLSKKISKLPSKQIRE
ncbi:MAG: HeH/LEM domain-containing protein [Promethearchaeota archaeon]